MASLRAGFLDRDVSAKSRQQQTTCLPRESKNHQCMIVPFSVTGSVPAYRTVLFNTVLFNVLQYHGTSVD